MISLQISLIIIISEIKLYRHCKAYFQNFHFDKTFIVTSKTTLSSLKKAFKNLLNLVVFNYSR